MTSSKTGRFDGQARAPGHPPQVVPFAGIAIVPDRPGRGAFGRRVAGRDHVPARNEGVDIHDHAR